MATIKLVITDKDLDAGTYTIEKERVGDVPVNKLTAAEIAADFLFTRPSTPAFAQAVSDFTSAANAAFSEPSVKVSQAVITLHDEDEDAGLFGFKFEIENPNLFPAKGSAAAMTGCYMVGMLKSGRAFSQAVWDFAEAMLKNNPHPDRRIANDRPDFDEPAAAAA